MVRDVAGLIACNALFLLAGAGLLRLLGAWRSLRGLARTLGVAYLGGIAAVGVTLQLMLVLGAPFNRWVVIAVCAALASTGFAARRPSDLPPFAIRVPSYLMPVAGALVTIVALMAVDLWFQPLGVWDAWAQWTAKARALVLFEGLNGDVLGSAPYHSWNPDYPMLIPAIEGSDFTFMHRIDTRAIHIQFLLIYAGFLLALLQLLRGRVREVLVWPVVLAIALAPAVQIQTASALADVPVGVFFAIAGILAWRWVVDEEALALRLFPLFAAGAYATKFEGRIYVGALSVAMAVVVAIAAPARLARTLAAVAVALVGIVPWSLWTSHHEVVGVFSTSLRERLGSGLITNADRIPSILEALARNVGNPTRWLALALVVAVSLVVAWPARENHVGRWLVVGTLALSALGLVLSYWATPLDLNLHLTLSARRVVTGPMLFAIVLVPLLLEGAVAARARRTGS